MMLLSVLLLLLLDDDGPAMIAMVWNRRAHHFFVAQPALQSRSDHFRNGKRRNLTLDGASFRHIHVESNHEVAFPA